MTAKERNTKEGYQGSQETPFLIKDGGEVLGVRKIMMRHVKTWILLATTERAMIPTGKDPIANMVYRPRLDSSFRKSNLL